jgi:coenzyme Q-binding protein COQ10
MVASCHEVHSIDLQGGCRMPRHEEQATLAYGADELFAVVADIKEYPSFIPWCTGAHIRSEGQQEILADLVIGFGPFHESFTSQVELDRPRQLRVRAIEGPLEHLNNTWTFTPVEDKTHVDFAIDFQFKSHLLDHVANGMFYEAATRMMSAFASRVHLLHMMRQRAAAARGAPAEGARAAMPTRSVRMST